MRAVCFWSGAEFGLLEAMSVLSTAQRTSFDPVDLFFDERAAPVGRYWDALDGVPRLRKLPSGPELARISDAFLGGRLRAGLHPAIVSDLFRLGHLLEHGGAWLDLDSIQVRDLRPLAEARGLMVGWEDETTIATGVLAARRGHPVLAALLGEARHILEAEEPEYRALGPPLFTRLVKEHGLEGEVLPPPYFYPVHYSRGEEVVWSSFPLPAETYAIHVWGFFHRRVFAGKDLAHFSGADSTLLNLMREIAREAPALTR